MARTSKTTMPIAEHEATVAKLQETNKQLLDQVVPKDHLSQENFIEKLSIWLSTKGTWVKFVAGALMGFLAFQFGLTVDEVVSYIEAGRDIANTVADLAIDLIVNGAGALTAFFSLLGIDPFNGLRKVKKFDPQSDVTITEEGKIEISTNS